MTINGYTIKPVLKGYQVTDKDGHLLHYFINFVDAINKVIELVTSK